MNQDDARAILAEALGGIRECESGDFWATQTYLERIRDRAQAMIEEATA